MFPILHVHWDVQTFLILFIGHWSSWQTTRCNKYALQNCIITIMIPNIEKLMCNNLKQSNLYYYLRNILSHMASPNIKICNIVMIIQNHIGLETMTLSIYTLNFNHYIIIWDMKMITTSIVHIFIMWHSMLCLF